MVQKIFSSIRGFASVLFVSTISFCFGFLGCSSKPVIPEGKNVTVSRDAAKKSCQELGRVIGRTISAKPNLEAALEDMKNEAALKGANYVQMETASGMQTAMAGTAYFCP
ncbi:MAG: DUF4156 domain-containing protein [Bdellovibrionales bacterium]|jgi:hypothetical protein|nr:DUF4156 domain-containing protein [Bdellovibrionales bacterium]